MTTTTFTIPASTPPLGSPADQLVADVYGRDLLWKENNTQVTASGDYALVDSPDRLSW